jgi:HSP20 family protein
MTKQSSRETSGAPAIIKLLPEDRFFQRIAGFHELIARRAYHLFEEAGYREGHDLENWLLAESQLQIPVSLELIEAKEKITVKAVLPEFNASEVEIHVQPRRLFITGERVEDAEKHKVNTGHCEELLQRVFRSIDLPAEIDPDKVKATLNQGELQIELPKAKAGQKVAKAKRAAA